MSATRDVLVTDEVLMGSHRNCIAQQAYFDARPRDIPRGKAQILVERGVMAYTYHPLPSVPGKKTEAQEEVHPS